MGSSSSNKMHTIGYRYFFDIHMGIGRGPVDELVELRIGDRLAWRGNVGVSSMSYIESHNLFGGDEKEGGVYGLLRIMMGESTQTPQHYWMRGIWPANLIPGFRRCVTVIFQGMVTAMNPYPKTWAWRVRRTTKGWDGAVWHPELAKIIYADTED